MTAQFSVTHTSSNMLTIRICYSRILQVVNKQQGFTRGQKRGLWRGKYPLELKSCSQVSSSLETYLRTTGCHLSYVIAQYYLPPNTCEHAPP